LGLFQGSAVSSVWRFGALPLDAVAADRDAAAMVELVRATGVVALAAFGWGALMGILTGNAQLTKIQLKADPAVVAALLADADKLDASRLALHLDFALLTLYGLTFVLLGLLLTRRGERWHSIAGAAVIAGAIITCLCDVVENARTLRLIPADGMEAVTQSALDALRTVSYAKWTASALTIALITLLFVGRGRARIVIALGLVTGAAALLGLIGVIGQSRVTLQIYFTLLGFLLPVVGVLFVGWPQKFLRGYR
jgi:hypothetical protein